MVGEDLSEQDIELNIYIKGVSFKNKGAELMLQCVKREITSWNKGNTGLVDLRVGSFARRKKAGLGTFVWAGAAKYPFFGPMSGCLGEIIPRSVRQSYGLVTERELDVILDASGFGYSDQWGSLHIERMAESCQRWKRQGKPIILLPQALGPFEQKAGRKAFSNVIENVDLVFVRDPDSYRYVANLSCDMSRIFKSPDFTNLAPSELPEDGEKYRNYVAIVPNRRMVNSSTAFMDSKYFDFLRCCANYLLKKKVPVFFLIHETYDLEIAKLVNSNLTKKLEIVEEVNPFYLKGIIGECSFIIGARYHALVSALSQGVPALGTGWSHKYKWLYSDYEMSEFLVDMDEDIRRHEFLLDVLIDVNQRKAIKKVLTENSKKQLRLTRDMWTRVRELAMDNKV